MTMRRISTPMRAYMQLIVELIFDRQSGLGARRPPLDLWLQHRTW
jgi:hypothetical protein